MTFSDIKEFTYIQNTVTIDGVGRDISSTCPVRAVQYHEGRAVLEEPLMVSVDESTYQYAITEWVEAAPIPEAEPIEVAQVTMRQARLALLQSGMLEEVTEAINSGSNETLKIEWEYSTAVRRDWQGLEDLMNNLGKLDYEIDSLFDLAKTL